MADASPIDVSYVTPQSIIAVAVVFSSLSIIFVTLRFYLRRSQKLSLWWDDWLLLPGLFFVVGLGVDLIIGAKGGGVGYGKDLPPGAPMEAQFTWTSPATRLTGKAWYAGQLLQILALGLIKLSVLLLYRRLFCVHQKSWISIATWAMAAVVIAWTIAFFFVFIFYCGIHFGEQWSTVVRQIEYCPNGLKYQLGLSISDTIADYLILLMPIPLIMQLRLSTSKKVVLVGVFMMGAFAAVTSTVRMGIFIKIVNIGFNPNLDGDKDAGLVLFWSMAEAGAAVMAACLPTFKPLFSRSSAETLKNGFRAFSSLLGRSSRQSSVDSKLEANYSDSGSGSGRSNSDRFKHFQKPETYVQILGPFARSEELPSQNSTQVSREPNHAM